MIADVRGYTRFTREQGDEAAARLAAKFAEIAHEGVEAHGGELLETRGDEILASFASARAALRTAVELQDAFADETQLDPSLPLTVGIGIAAGEAVPVGDGFRGGALNVAARLCAQARAGDVFVSDELVGLAGRVDAIEFESVGPMELKGLDEPVQVRRVVAKAAERAAPMPVPGPRGELPPELDPATPLVGRTRELRVLRWAWRRARHGHGRAAFLSGPSGIGKTRLAAELAREAYAHGGSVVYARCAGPAQEALGELQRAAITQHPTLVVVDDLDAAGGTVLDTTAATVVEVGQRPILLVGTYRDESPLVRSLLDRVEEPPAELTPLDADDVRAIAALYAGRAVASLPLGELVESTGGVPALVHRAAGEWARRRAAGRLSASATQTASDRGDLRDAETALAESLLDLHHANERTVLYADEAVEAVICPYKGLATFDLADADYFFGREQLVAELVARLVGTSFLAVVGPSGSGKSSAVRAGLLPALAAGVIPGSERWTRMVVRPGEHPLAVFDRASAAPAGGRVVVVIDQFEELFTACADERERDGFVRAITSPGDDRVVVVALRADYYGRCAEYPKLAGLLGANQVLVGPMQEEEVRRAIELPARRVGLRVEPELVDALVADVAGQAGGLPLLSTALLELWQRRDGRTLSLARYRETGGVKGAVARLAEDAYERLTPEQQLLARAILLRLAGAGEGDAVVRRRAALSEFDAEDNEDVARVLRVLTDARLLTTSEDKVEVAHEALLREWPRLRSWVEEDAEGRRLHLHLMEQAREWAQRGRDDADLYRGARLGSALDWTAAHTVELNERERAFLEASRNAHERSNRRLRVGLAVVAGLLVLAVVAGALFLVQRGRARDEAIVATARELAAAAEATLAIDPERSILLAIEAVETTRRHDGSILREAEEALHEAVSSSRTALVVRGARHDVAFAPNGRRFVSIGTAGNAIIWDASTGQRVATLDEHSKGIYSVEYSADGRSIVTASADGSAMLWDADTGSPLRTFRVRPRSVIVSAHFNADGTRVVTIGDDARARVWDVRTGAQLRAVKAWKPTKELLSANAGRPELAFLGGGSRLIVANPLFAGRDPLDDVFVRVWDIASGELLAAIENPDLSLLNDFDVSADGKLAVVGEEGGDVSLVRLSDGEILDEVSVGTGFANDVEFSPDGTRVAAATSHASALVWDVTRGGLRELFTLAGHAAVVESVSFSRDGSRLLTASADGTARIWDVSPGGGRELVAFPGSISTVPGRALDFTPDGQRLVASSGPIGTVRAWDLSTRKQILELPHANGSRPPENIFGLDVSDDGTRIVTANGNGAATVFDARTGAELTAFSGHERECGETAEIFCVLDVDFNSDGTRVAAASGNSTTRIFDAATGNELQVLRGHATFVWTVEFSPDDKLIVTAGSFDATAKLWDAETGKLLRTLSHRPKSDYAYAADFSPDGSRVATVGSHGKIRIWDVRSGRLLREVATGLGELFDVVFAPDGHSIATSGSGDTIAFVDAGTGATLRKLNADAPLELEFSPNGELFAWSSPPPNPSIQVAVLDVERLIALARDRVTRALTDEECREYLHLDRCADRD